MSIESIERIISEHKVQVVDKIITVLKNKVKFNIPEYVYVIDPDEPSNNLTIQSIDIHTKTIALVDIEGHAPLIYGMDDLKIEELINIYKIITV